MRARDVLLAFVPLACGNNNVLLSDASDAELDGDAPSCLPAMLSGDAAFGTMNPPKAPHANVCTMDQISEYVLCDVDQNTSQCSTFQSGPPPGAACAACIESQSTDAKWGVLVFNPMTTTGTPNIAGCVDDALGQVAMEPSSCGDLIYASYQCQSAACSACGGPLDASDFDTCDAVAVATVCAAQNAAVQSPTGPCAPLFADGGLGTAGNCFPDTAIVDPVMQQIDWLKRIIGYMCGP